MSKPAKPIPCNWLLLPEMKNCPKPAEFVMQKSGAGYCAEHVKQAEKMFGPATKIFREELFER